MSASNNDALDYVKMSQMFLRQYIPYDIAYKFSNEVVLNALSLNTFQKVQVSVFNGKKVFRDYEHTFMTRKVDGFYDADANQSFFVSEIPPQGCTIESYVKNFCLTQEKLQKAFKTVMKILVPIFAEIQTNGYGLQVLEPTSIFLNHTNGDITDVKIANHMLNNCDSNSVYKWNLCLIASFFNSASTCGSLFKKSIVDTFCNSKMAFLAALYPLSPKTMLDLKNDCFLIDGSSACKNIRKTKKGFKTFIRFFETEFPTMEYFDICFQKPIEDTEEEADSDSDSCSIISHAPSSLTDDVAILQKPIEIEFDRLSVKTAIETESVDDVNAAKGDAWGDDNKKLTEDKSVGYTSCFSTIINIKATIDSRRADDFLPYDQDRSFMMVGEYCLQPSPTEGALNFGYFLKNLGHKHTGEVLDGFQIKVTVVSAKETLVTSYQPDLTMRIHFEHDDVSRIEFNGASYTQYASLPFRVADVLAEVRSVVNNFYNKHEIVVAEFPKVTFILKRDGFVYEKDGIAVFDLNHFDVNEVNYLEANDILTEFKRFVQFPADIDAVTLVNFNNVEK